jgi:hypothetical protein
MAFANREFRLFRIPIAYESLFITRVMLLLPKCYRRYVLGYSAVMERHFCSALVLVNGETGAIRHPDRVQIRASTLMFRHQLHREVIFPRRKLLRFN